MADEDRRCSSGKTNLPQSPSKLFFRVFSMMDTQFCTEYLENTRKQLVPRKRIPRPKAEQNFISDEDDGTVYYYYHDQENQPSLEFAPTSPVNQPVTMFEPSAVVEHQEQGDFTTLNIEPGDFDDLQNMELDDAENSQSVEKLDDIPTENLVYQGNMTVQQNYTDDDHQQGCSNQIMFLYRNMQMAALQPNEQGHNQQRGQQQQSYEQGHNYQYGQRQQPHQQAYEQVHNQQYGQQQQPQQQWYEQGYCQQHGQQQQLYQQAYEQEHNQQDGQQQHESQQIQQAQPQDNGQVAIDETFIPTMMDLECDLLSDYVQSDYDQQYK